MSEEVVLEVKNLKKYFPAGKGHELHAVDDVSFQIHAGETLGLVGESGCGKTTCARTLIGMYQPTAGQVLPHDRQRYHCRRSGYPSYGLFKSRAHEANL